MIPPNERPSIMRAFTHDNAYGQVRQLRVKASSCHDLHNKLFDQGLVKSEGARCAIVKSDAMMGWAHGLRVRSAGYARRRHRGPNCDYYACRMLCGLGTSGLEGRDKLRKSWRHTGHTRACTCLQICNLTSQIWPFDPMQLPSSLKR